MAYITFVEMLKKQVPTTFCSAHMPNEFLIFCRCSSPKDSKESSTSSPSWTPLFSLYPSKRPFRKRLVCCMVPKEFGVAGKECNKPRTNSKISESESKGLLNPTYERSKLSNDVVISSWRAPRQNSVKINVDFAMDDGKGIHGFGIIIRDGRGSFIATKSIEGWGSMQSECGELLAIKEGLLFAIELEYSRICIESDSQVSINRILDASPDYSHYGSILLDFFFLLLNRLLFFIVALFRVGSIV